MATLGVKGLIHFVAALVITTRHAVTVLHRRGRKLQYLLSFLCRCAKWGSH